MNFNNTLTSIEHVGNLMDISEDYYSQFYFFQLETIMKHLQEKPLRMYVRNYLKCIN